MFRKILLLWLISIRVCELYQLYLTLSQKHLSCWCLIYSTHFVWKCGKRLQTLPTQFYKNIYMYTAQDTSFFLEIDKARSDRGPFSGAGLSIQLFQEVLGQFNHTRNRIASKSCISFQISNRHSLNAFHFKSATDTHSITPATKINIFSISREIAFSWISHLLTADTSTLVPVMAWCH